MVDISVETITAYALENAIKYDGKTNQKAVLAGLFSAGLEKSGIKNIIPKLRNILDKVNSTPLEEQKKEFEKLEFLCSKREIREGLKELPNAKMGKVVMRMAPFPSGPLHIGNARTFILNDEYIKMYNGKLLLVMDDTIGSEAKRIEPESYELIKEGIDWLNIKYDKKIIYKSDRIEKYYEYAEELLKKGYLYVCHCEQEKMHELKVKGIECSCRNLPPEKQIERWKEMFKAEMGSMTVRLKTSMQDSDPAFRDRVMFKISDFVHPKTKNKFRVYPSMEFSWGIDDHVFGVTHVLRGTDHYMSTRIQNFIRNIFGWENPESIYNGACKIEGIKISKSKGTKKIKAGIYTGWNDPRTWSLQSLKDRGIEPKAIRQFIINLGIKNANITAPVEALYLLNRKIIENAPRYSFVENPQKITIKGCPYLKTEIPRHPNNSLGNKIIETTQDFLIPEADFDLLDNRDYRLIHLLTFNSNRTGINPRELSFISEEPTNKKLKFIHWLPATPDNIKIKLLMPDGKIRRGLGEFELGKLKIGSIVQFERVGFAKLYKKDKEELEFWFAHN